MPSATTPTAAPSARRRAACPRRGATRAGCSCRPQLGVFTSFDTLAGGAQNPITLNRFLYAGANPATLIDPDGHMIMNYTMIDEGYTWGTIAGHPRVVDVSPTVWMSSPPPTAPRIDPVGGSTRQSNLAKFNSYTDVGSTAKAPAIAVTPTSIQIKYPLTSPGSVQTKYPLHETQIVASTTDSGPLPQDVFSGGCIGVSGQVGLFGSAAGCFVGGHFQIQLQGGASSGIGVSLPFFEGVWSNAPSGTQLSGFGGGYGGSVGAGLVGGSDRGFSQWNGQTYETVSYYAGFGGKLSPELVSPGEVHAWGSFTFDINDFVGAAWNWLTGK
jgi:hypothetical protein